MFNNFQGGIYIYVLAILYILLAFVMW